MDGRNVFDQPLKNDIKTYENIRKPTTGQRDDYTTGCLLDYNYFKKHNKMIAIDLRKQEALDSDPKAIQQLNFTASLSDNNNILMFFIIEEVKETILDFSQGTIKVLRMSSYNLATACSTILCCFNIISYKMAQHNTLNAKLSTLQLNKSKSGIKNGTEVTLKISSNIVGDSNDENNFSHELLLTKKQFSGFRKVFANNSSANIKLSKTQLHKIGQSGGFLGRLLGPLLEIGLPLIKNVLKPLAKSILITLGLTAAVPSIDVAVHKKMFGSATTTLLVSNEEMNDIKKT